MDVRTQHFITSSILREVNLARQSSLLLLRFRIPLTHPAMRLISFDLGRLLYHTLDDTFDGDNGYSFRQNGVCKVSASDGIQFQNNETSLME